MSWWQHYPKSEPGDSLDDLAYGPSGGRVKRWLAGAVLAGVPVVYGIACLARGYTCLWGRGRIEKLYGEAGVALAIAYISIGAFLHFHYFCGLSLRLERFSQPGKILCILVFLPSFFYAIYRGFVRVLF